MPLQFHDTGALLNCREDFRGPPLEKHDLRQLLFKLDDVNEWSKTGSDTVCPKKVAIMLYKMQLAEESSRGMRWPHGTVSPLESPVVRMCMRRFTRLTNAFSKKTENHTAAVSLHFMYYNFALRHQTLRKSPAMAAGVADRLWSVEDIVGLLPELQYNTRPKKNQKGVIIGVKADDME